MNAPNTPQRIVLVIAAVAVLALAFYPPFFPHYVRTRRIDIELAAVTLAAVALVLALRGLPKTSLSPIGWKRLWIVLSLIYLSVVVGIAWHLYPAYPSEEARILAGVNETDEEARRMVEIFGSSTMTPTLRAYYASEQRGFLIHAALWAIFPIAALYMLCMAWGWVYRGFRGGRSVKEEKHG